MERTVFLEVHCGGTIERTTGTTVMLSAHTYIGGNVTNWRVPKSECHIWNLVVALRHLAEYNPEAFFFYEDINSAGRGTVAPLQTAEDAVALGRLADKHARIRVFVDHGSKLLDRLTTWNDLPRFLQTKVLHLFGQRSNFDFEGLTLDREFKVWYYATIKHHGYPCVPIRPGSVM